MKSRMGLVLKVCRFRALCGPVALTPRLVKDLIEKELNSLIEVEVNRLLEELIPASEIEALATDRKELKARRYELHNA